MRRFVKKTFIIVLLAIAVTIATVIVTVVFIANFLDLNAFRQRQATLQESADFNFAELYMSNLPAPVHSPGGDVPAESAFDAQMREINPDYVCWIRIEGTVVDYPVVRGEDNEKYLNMSFHGDKNALGSLFMDYRCAAGTIDGDASAGGYVPHIIIYGHNAKSGDLFGNLWRLLDGDYLAEHPKIALIAGGRIVEYEIFSVRESDITDAAYNVDFSAPNALRDFAESCGAPPDTLQIVTLSTCVSAGDDDARVIVQGALAQNKGSP